MSPLTKIRSMEWRKLGNRKRRGKGVSSKQRKGRKEETEEDSEDDPALFFEFGQKESGVPRHRSDPCKFSTVTLDEQQGLKQSHTLSFYSSMQDQWMTFEAEFDHEAPTPTRTGSKTVAEEMADILVEDEIEFIHPKAGDDLGVDLSAETADTASSNTTTQDIEHENSSAIPIQNRRVRFKDEEDQALESAKEISSFLSFGEPLEEGGSWEENWIHSQHNEVLASRQNEHYEDCAEISSIVEDLSELRKSRAGSKKRRTPARHRRRSNVNVSRMASMEPDFQCSPTRDIAEVSSDMVDLVSSSLIDIFGGPVRPSGERRGSSSRGTEIKLEERDEDTSAKVEKSRISKRDMGSMEEDITKSKAKVLNRMHRWAALRHKKMKSLISGKHKANDSPEPVSVISRGPSSQKKKVLPKQVVVFDNLPGKLGAISKVDWSPSVATNVTDDPSSVTFPNSIVEPRNKVKSSTFYSVLNGGCTFANYIECVARSLHHSGMINDDISIGDTLTADGTTILTQGSAALDCRDPFVCREI